VVWGWFCAVLIGVAGRITGQKLSSSLAGGAFWYLPSWPVDNETQSQVIKTVTNTQRIHLSRAKETTTEETDRDGKEHKGQRSASHLARVYAPFMLQLH